MQQFTVPQFIDVEDKIIGPITARQFVIMLSGFLLIGICYKIFEFTIFVFLGIIIFSIFGVFAFLKINGMPFHFFILNFVQTSKRPNLRVWNSYYGKKINLKEEKEDLIHDMPQAAPPKTFTASRLAELSLIVDTQGGYKGESQSIEKKEPKIKKIQFDEEKDMFSSASKIDKNIKQ